MPKYTAHEDRFVWDNLPPDELRPELIFDLPSVRYPERLNCAAELLDPWVERGPSDRPCLIDADSAWSYPQVRERVNRIANVLVEDFGIVPGNRVLLHGHNSPMLVACWLAIVKAGAVVVTTIPQLRARELGYIIDKAQVRLALCEARLRHSLAELRRRQHVLEDILTFNGTFNPDDPDPLEARKAMKPTDFAAVDTAADDPCMIAFTEGTTGQPKATVHLHRDVMAGADCFGAEVLKANAKDVFCTSPSIGFTFGFTAAVVLPLRAGASSVLVSRPAPDDFLAALERHRATICCAATSTYKAMLDALGAYDLSSLRRCLAGGEPMHEQMRAAFKHATGLDIIGGIGATELLGLFVSADPAANRPGTVGRVVPGYRIITVDDDGNPLPRGQVGRLAVKGPTGCLYLADDRQSEYVRNGWNVTGNACLIDADGYVHYRSRADELIVSSSYIIAGREVEEALLAHRAVRQCAVIGVPNPDRGEIVKAFVVLEAGSSGDDSTINDLQEFLKDEIAPFKCPREFTFVDQLPLTKSGSVQRFKLRALEIGRASEHS
jgi:2-aminobenzoate-CoA ligase